MTNNILFDGMGEGRGGVEDESHSMTQIIQSEKKGISCFLECLPDLHGEEGMGCGGR
jgi:hypothetical protein